MVKLNGSPLALSEHKLFFGLPAESGIYEIETGKVNCGVLEVQLIEGLVNLPIGNNIILGDTILYTVSNPAEITADTGAFAGAESRSYTRLKVSAPSASFGAASIGHVIRAVEPSTESSGKAYEEDFLNLGPGQLVWRHEKTVIEGATTTTSSKIIKGLPAAKVEQLAIEDKVTASLGGLHTGTNTVAAILGTEEIELNQAVATGHAANTLTFEAKPVGGAIKLFFENEKNLVQPVNGLVTLWRDPESARYRLKSTGG